MRAACLSPKTCIPCCIVQSCALIQTPRDPPPHPPWPLHEQCDTKRYGTLKVVSRTLRLTSVCLHVYVGVDSNTLSLLNDAGDIPLLNLGVHVVLSTRVRYL